MWKDLTDLLFQAYEQFGYLPLFIEIALIFIIVAILSTIIAYSVILYRRWQGYVYDKRIAFISPQIEDLITEQVLLNEKLEKVPIEEIEFDQEAISKLIYKKPWVRQVIIDIIIQYRKNFRGEVGELLRKLYVDMNLQKDSFDKMKTLRWDKK